MKARMLDPVEGVALQSADEEDLGTAACPLVVVASKLKPAFRMFLLFALFIISYNGSGLQVYTYMVI